MLKLYIRVKDTIQNFHLREEAQDGFEYLLVTGVVMTAIVVLIAAGGSGPITAVWGAVSTKLTTTI